jgi:hypothetical protein
MAAALDTRADPFATLPHALALDIVSRLTVEQRLRIEVCRGWRATLTDRAAWLQLDLRRADNSECSEALLRASTSRAGGELRSLCLACSGRSMQAAVCAVAAGNATTLVELRISTPGAARQCGVQDLEALLRAAPQLRTLEADVSCANAAEAHRILRNEPPFGPLRVRELCVNAVEATADAVPALAADLAAHSWLTSFELYNAHLDAPSALDAVADAALARRVSLVLLGACHLSPASAPALARLVRGDTLTELSIDGRYGPAVQLLDAPAAVLLGNALRANTSLTALTLAQVGLWHDAAAAAELMDALTAHPRLRLLDLARNRPANGGFQRAEVGAMLAALLLANAPALQTLDISRSGLGDEGMGPVVEALRHNTHLTKLDCHENDVSDAAARDTLLPALRANTSLRELIANGLWGCDVIEGAREVEALVAARAQPQ